MCRSLFIALGSIYMIYILAFCPIISCDLLVLALVFLYFHNPSSFAYYWIPLYQHFIKRIFEINMISILILCVSLSVRSRKDPKAKHMSIGRKKFNMDPKKVSCLEAALITMEKIFRILYHHEYMF